MWHQLLRPQDCRDTFFDFSPIKNPAEAGQYQLLLDVSRDCAGVQWAVDDHLDHWDQVDVVGG